MAKVLLVTGGSRGIGAAICRLGARAGDDVAVHYAGRADAAEEVAQAVRAAGRQAVTIQGDVADEHAVAAMFDRTAAELGPVDAFVSNAGVIHKAAPLADIPIAEIRRIVEVDLTAHLICCREAVRRMSNKRMASVAPRATRVSAQLAAWIGRAEWKAASTMPATAGAAIEAT